MRKREEIGRQDKNDAHLGRPASFPLGWFLAGHLCGRSSGLLVLRALRATSAAFRGSFCSTGCESEFKGTIKGGGVKGEWGGGRADDKQGEFGNGSKPGY